MTFVTEDLAPARRAGAGAASRIVGVVGRTIAAAAARRRRARDIRHLLAADDRILADIGLTRDAVRVAAAIGRLPDLHAISRTD